MIRAGLTFVEPQLRGMGHAPPTAYPGLHTWLDSRNSSLPPEHNGHILFWPDQRGDRGGYEPVVSFGYPKIQRTTNLTPTLQPTVYMTNPVFTGAWMLNRLTIGAAWPGLTTGFTVYMWVNWVGPIGTVQQVWAGGDIGTVQIGRLEVGGPSIWGAGGRNDDCMAHPLDWGGTQPLTITTHIVCWTMPPAFCQLNAFAYTDDPLTPSGGPGAYSVPPDTRFGIGVGSGPGIGDWYLACVLVYETVHDAATRQAIFGWLTQVFGPPGFMGGDSET